MQLKIIPFKNDYKIHKIEKSFSKIFEINTEINPLYRLFKFCCLNNNNNEIVIIYNNPDSKFCLYFSEKIPDTILYIIKKIFNKKDHDLNMVYQLLLIIEELDLNYNLFYQILDYVNWPSGKKGFDYFISFKSFSQKLKEFIFNKSFSLSDAYFFHEYFQKDYDLFLELLPVKLTFTERSNIIRNVTEFAKKEKKSINDIIKLLKNFGNSKNKSNIFDFSKKLRYPKRSKYKKYFITKVDKLKLPKGININFDDTFEREYYSMEIKFNNFSSLFNKIKQIEKSLEKYFSKDDFIDFFNHDKLFKNNEK